MNWRAETTLFSPWYRKNLWKVGCAYLVPATLLYIAVSIPWIDLSLGSRLGIAAWRPTALQEPKEAALLALDPITHSSSRDLHHPLCRLTAVIAEVRELGFYLPDFQEVVQNCSHWVLGKILTSSFSLLLKQPLTSATYSNWESPQSELLLLMFWSKVDHFFQLFWAWQITQNSISTNLMGQVTVTKYSWISIS